MHCHPMLLALAGQPASGFDIHRESLNHSGEGIVFNHGDYRDL